VAYKKGETYLRKIKEIFVKKKTVYELPKLVPPFDGATKFLQDWHNDNDKTSVQM
jgi:hypothetical protein